MDRRLSRHFWKTRRPNRQNAPSADRSVGSALSGQVRPRDNGRGPTASARSPRVNLAALRTVKLLRHGSNAGHSSGVAGVDARRATPQIQGWRAGSSLAVASSTTANPLLSPAKIRELNHAAFVSLSYSTDRQVLRNPHIGRPGFLVSMSLHPRTALRRGRHAGLLLAPNCQRWVSTIPPYIVYDKIAGILRVSPDE